MAASDAPFDYEAVPAGFYDTVYRHGRGIRYCWHDLKFRAVARALAGRRRLLDIGCGPGTFIGNYMAGVACLGIDVAAPQIDYANRHYATDEHRFSTRSIAELASSGETFDALALIEVIEHLPGADARRLLEQVRGLLSADGILVLTTPNYASLWPVIEWGVNIVSSVSYEGQHINKYTRARLRSDLAASGYREIAIRTAVGFAPFTAVLGNGFANGVEALETAVGHCGIGNLLLATARPGA